MRTPGFQWFVAWRYLMARPRRLSGTILVFAAAFAGVLLAAGLAAGLQPLTDDYIAAGLPVPWWLPPGFGLLMALPLVLPYTMAIWIGWLVSGGDPARRRGPGGEEARRRSALRKMIVGGGCLGGGVLWVRFAPDLLAGWLDVDTAITTVVIGGLLAVGATVMGAVALLWGLGQYLELRLGLETRRLRAPRWGRGLGAALFVVGAVAGSLAAAGLLGASGPVVTGACLALAPVVVIVAGATVSPSAIPGWVPAAITAAAGLAIGLVALASYQAGEGDLLYNLPGLIDEPAPWLSPIALVPAAGALIALVAALVRPDWRVRAMRIAALVGSLAVVGVALVLWLRMSSWAATELGRPNTAITYHYPMWLSIPAAIAGVLFVLTLILLVIRYFFTFFTTVSMGGVAIGSMALVITLSVMSGFENDLREKILGSNAHVLISRTDDQPFTDYREVMQRVAATPGIEGLTPYLTSEVVIAGSSNYFNVIIKGVDPRTIARVTDLGNDLEDPSALDRLWPLRDDGGVGGPPPDAGAAPEVPDGEGPDEEGPDEDLVDPAPDDLDVGDTAPPDLSGGLTASPAPPEVVDPAPGDLQIGDTAPPDFSGGLTESPELPDAGPPDDAGARPGGPPEGGEPIEGLEGEVIIEAEDWQPPPARELAPEVAALPGVLVGRELVKQINLYVGQEVKVISPLGQNTLAGQTPYVKPYRVAGVFFTGMYEYDLKLIYVELTTLQDFLDLPDVVTGIEIRVSDPENTEPVLSRLRRMLGPEYKVQDWKEINRSLFSALKLEKIAMFLVLAIIILVASFSIVGNLIMVVVEKAREIAVLKTLGASDAGVTRIFIVQGFFIGLIGTAIGVSLGLVASYLLDYFGLPIPPDVYYIDRLPIHVDLGSVALVAAAGVLISVGATIYPAQIAARLRPVQGLRYE